MDTFTVRDLRERTGELIRDAEAGKLSVVTKHGRPVFVAVPWSESMLRDGLQVALAIKLFDEEVVSLGRAARIADLSVEEFIGRLGALGIPVVRYPPEELEAELKNF
jgi:prevent-host-death family protein